MNTQGSRRFRRELSEKAASSEGNQPECRGWAGRVQEGYRKAKVVICTRFERENGRKPGTGEEKWSSVPELSAETGGNRVQERKSVHLYPI